MQIQRRIHQSCSDQWDSNFRPKSFIQPDNWHQYLQTYDSVVENRNHILFYFSCFEDHLWVHILWKIFFLTFTF